MIQAAMGIYQVGSSTAGYFRDKALEGIRNKYEERINKVNNDLSASEAAYNNSMREARNTTTAGRVSSELTGQTIRYKQRAAALGSQYSAVTRQLVREASTAANNSMAVRLEAAAQLGTVTAQLAAGGVVGGSAEALQNTMRRQSAYRQTVAGIQADQRQYELGVQRAAIVGSLADPDVIGVLAEMDHGTNVARSTLFQPTDNVQLDIGKIMQGVGNIAGGIGRPSSGATESGASITNGYGLTEITGAEKYGFTPITSGPKKAANPFGDFGASLF